MQPSFRYWLSPDVQRAVTFIEGGDQIHIFTVDVSTAMTSYPSESLENAVYKLAINKLNSES